MPIKVRHLNADSSFLLTLSPDEPTSPGSHYLTSEPYTILIDPWIVGPSIVSASWFAISKRNAPACVSHLSELPEPDMVIASQNKSDHCHKDTLLQLRPEGKAMIVAEPGAAKAIKSWNHFDPARVFALPKYNPRDRFSLLRFHIPPPSHGGHPGEVTVAFIPAKVYMTGLHNAIGITYRPPTSGSPLGESQTMKSPTRSNFLQLPLSPSSLGPRSPSLSPPASETASTDDVDLAVMNNYRPQISKIFKARSIELMYSTQSTRTLPTPPLSPASTRSPPANNSTTTFSTTTNNETPSPATTSLNNDMTISPPTLLQSSMLPTPPSSPNLLPPTSPSPSSPSPLPRPLSILYTPHGIPFTPDLQPYIRTHLLSLCALPLTLLLHSFTHLQNPWYLGGTVMNGCAGGVEIARGLMARAWVSAHDEEKDDRGVAVRRTVAKRVGVEEVRRRVGDEEEKHVSGGGGEGKKGWRCEVRSLGVGEEMVVEGG
ncbi:MAG: hypothetical protein Q9160_004059 [Pyrenula sp. 1 TL-2023]